jgi:hypothetical protein
MPHLAFAMQNGRGALHGKGEQRYSTAPTNRPWTYASVMADTCHHALESSWCATVCLLVYHARHTETNTSQNSSCVNDGCWHSARPPRRSAQRCWCSSKKRQCPLLPYFVEVALVRRRSFTPKVISLSTQCDPNSARIDALGSTVLWWCRWFAAVGRRVLMTQRSFKFLARPSTASAPSAAPVRLPVVAGPVINVTEGMVQAVEADARTHAGTTAQMLSSALAVNDDNLDIIARIEGDVAKAEGDLGLVAQILEEDNERIQRIDAKLKSMDSLTARAQRELVYIVRNLCKDRCFTFLIILTLVAVSCVGALFIRKSIADANQGKQTTVVVQPATPPPTPSPA